MASMILRTLFAIFNIIHRILQLLGWELIPMTIDNVIKPLTPDERKEFLRNDFNEAVKLILEGCNEPAGTVTGMQRYITINMIRNHTRCRAGVRGEVARNPDILNTPVDGPIVIVGLARSGTTMLHRLLACDPQFLSTMTWEMMKPIPAGRPENWRECQRYKEAEKEIADLVQMQPEEFKTVHHVAADAQEECLMLLGHCFLNVSESPGHIQEKWSQFQINCPKEYQRKAYEYYKMALQCLYYKNLDGGEKLLLKSPIHLLYLDTYREFFPNAKFIFTYRHLGSVIPSACSLVKQMTKTFGFPVDHNHIGRNALKYYKLSCDAALDSFKKIPQDSFITMGYSELMKDHMAAVRKIYSNFNLELTPGVEASMQRHLQDNRQYKFGKHKYSMEEFGITEDELKTTFKEFAEYFKDSSEKVV